MYSSIESLSGDTISTFAADHYGGLSSALCEENWRMHVCMYADPANLASHDTAVRCGGVCSPDGDVWCAGICVPSSSGQLLLDCRHDVCFLQRSQNSSLGL